MFRYLKLQTGHSKEVDMGDTAGDIAGSLKSNINARYVILEEVDEQEDSTWKPWLTNHLNSMSLSKTLILSSLNDCYVE